MGATPGLNKARKQKLVKAGKVGCGFCPYHKKENASKRPRPDAYKNHRRKAKTIVLFVV